MNSSTSNSEPQGVEQGRTFRVPVALGIAATVVVLIELAAHRIDLPLDRSTIFLPHDRVPTVVETIMEVKLQTAHASGERADILVVGDSSGLMGVDPRVCSERMDKEVYNLCTVSLIGAEGQQAILERYIRSHGAPGLVVYHYAPHELRHTDKEIAEWKLHEATLRWLAAADGNPMPRLDDQEDAARFSLPSQKFRENAQRWLSIESKQQRNRKTPRGAYASHDEMTIAINDRLGFSQEVAKEIVSAKTDLDLITPESQTQALDQLLTFTETQNIPIVLVASPLPSAVRSQHTLSALKRQRAKIRSIADRHSNASILFPQQRFYDTDDFATLNHLKPQAAVTNSIEISEQLLPLPGP